MNNKFENERNQSFLHDWKMVLSWTINEQYENKSNMPISNGKCIHSRPSSNSLNKSQGILMQERLFQKCTHLLYCSVM